jgi:hypothetical protein
MVSNCGSHRSCSSIFTTRRATGALDYLKVPSNREMPSCFKTVEIYIWQGVTLEDTITSVYL